MNKGTCQSSESRCLSFCKDNIAKIPPKSYFLCNKMFDVSFCLENVFPKFKKCLILCRDTRRTEQFATDL